MSINTITYTVEHYTTDEGADHYTISAIGQHGETEDLNAGGEPITSAAELHAWIDELISYSAISLDPAIAAELHEQADGLA